MFHRVIVKCFDSFLFSQIVRVGLGRAERVLDFTERAAKETVQLRLDLFGVFRLFDRFLHFVVRFRRGLLERIHELGHLAFSHLLQTIQSLLLYFRRAATLNNQNKPHGFFWFLFFNSIFGKKNPNPHLSSVHRYNILAMDFVNKSQYNIIVYCVVIYT